MSLIYRAIWQDEADGIHDHALAAFRWWVERRHRGERSFAPDAEETIGGTTTLVRNGNGDAGSIQRCTVHVDDGTDRLTTTLITTATATPAGDASVWVDHERVSRDAFAPFQVHAPPLSTRMIAKGIRPRRGPVALRVDPTALRPGDIRRFAGLLATPERDLPLVLFATGPELDGVHCLETARVAARVLAGSAAVFLVDAGRPVLAELVGSDLGVEAGGARIYLPGFAPDEDEPWRHRRLEPERVARDPQAAAYTIVQFLAPATAARRAPSEYPALRPLLQHGPNAEVEDHDRLVARTIDLEEQLAASENQVLDLLADLEEAQGRVNELQDDLVGLLTSGSIRARSDSDPQSADIDCCSDAATVAREHLDGVVLPEQACRDLPELDRRVEARTWGQSSWRAFVALDAYARDARFGSNFWEWCKAGRSPFTWPASPKKLAMHESESVLADPSLRAARIFAVDPLVDASGRILMEAHLKVVEGGGPQIPRIYFHDDRRGATGKVHIGFFGPHRHVPTSSY